jgi:hypothetical protein
VARWEKGVGRGSGVSRLFSTSRDRPGKRPRLCGAGRRRGAGGSCGASRMTLKSLSSRSGRVAQNVLSLHTRNALRPGSYVRALAGEQLSSDQRAVTKQPSGIDAVRFCDCFQKKNLVCTGIDVSNCV